MLKFQRYGQAASKSTWQLTAAKEASHHSSPSVLPYERLQPLFAQFATWPFSKSVSQKKLELRQQKKNHWLLLTLWAQVFIKQSGKQKTGRKGRKLIEHQEGRGVFPPGRQSYWISSHILSSQETTCCAKWLQGLENRPPKLAAAPGKKGSQEPF